jgi:hypothetical protein
VPSDKAAWLCVSTNGIAAAWHPQPFGPAASRIGLLMDERIMSILGFFEPEVLAAYREQPDKFDLATDHFEGHLSISSPYYARLDEKSQDQEYIETRFGYRTLRNGELKLAVFLPDLVEKSRGHLERWKAFVVDTDEWLDEDKDERFSLWVRRHMEGDWNVDSGPAFQILEEIRLINGVTAEATGRRLFNIDRPNIPYPAAQNTHRYEDAHRELYGVLIDGLDKTGIEQLGQRLGCPINAQSMKTRNALATILPAVANDRTFADPIENVSEQRRRASHKVRPPAQPMTAFEQFTKDLQLCHQAVRLLRTTIESELHMDAAKAARRQEALGHLPRIGSPSEPNYSINALSRMVGKTVSKVEYGFREEIKGVHQSELVIIHFTDGSIMSIETGSNARNLSDRAHEPQDFHVDFRVHWVPRFL